MTKPELIEALAQKGITPPDGASAADLKKLLDEANEVKEKPPLQPGQVVVRVTGQPVCEDGVHYVKGDEIHTTPERAAALGALVEAVV
jgi:threonine dehydrogenase-like Zn-dependent dehydrogenase